MMRIILFLLTNLAVVCVFGFILSFTKIPPESISGLLIFSSIFGFSGSIISLLMSKWIALKSVNGQVIYQPSNNTEQWLIDTINSQSKKMGIKTPTIAIYHAFDMNAFATGAYKNSALIAVSTGLLENMSYDEAEAVLAHEINHISNGDMVTMTLVQGIVNTFVIFISRIIAQFASSILSENREDNNSNRNTWVYIICSTILELIFGIFASIITMWFSRHREFYADAGSAKLVGRKKMISALQKLKLSYEPQEKSNIIAFCINGKHSSFLNLFMSHPSLDKRIQALYNRDYM
ncbi:putative protease HtpX [Buchnera aphidicola str. Bp (Baizongia pistaciae)]|uniref:Protease HtpX n=1 Tax=Buchnera aphidicola subsp. Baizongia pistaciae (strain Bp) TaxID=224915 RepID=HTPX_BUCBP|nr:protease HtpX [Buchnera aphidicola]P59559.1 RecName: Full=Protease HtpX; AltName: Full=Heat shock protein HtpX [Buchnera aphidicola str. Bp (Baizongia pistaciae)]AAO27024.1 putative protease HtpX [Buchnera aphidicola str. Bp (Baizongia pistaciae)]